MNKITSRQNLNQKLSFKQDADVETRDWTGLAQQTVEFNGGLGM